ncbi:MAG: hypothetical protein HC912_11530 [Saprospiraceae bacterium]|nr:hypothetical protein [Saprospiraceae bacterium]
MKYVFTVLFIFIFIADSLTQKVLKARSLETSNDLIRSEVPMPDNDERLPYEKLFENERISISTAYPNPAAGFTNFDYQLSDKAKEAKNYFERCIRFGHSRVQTVSTRKQTENSVPIHSRRGCIFIRSRLMVRW